MIIKHSIPTSHLKSYFFPLDFNLIKGLSSLTQYVHFSLWVFWNELQAEILRTIINRSKDIARKSKPKKEIIYILNQMTGQQVKATLRNGKETNVRLYISPLTLQIIPKAFSNEIPWFFPLKDKDFCSLFNISRRSLAGKKGARELLKEKNLVDYRIRWRGKKILEYKLLDSLEKIIELSRDEVHEIFYKNAFSYSSKVIFFWFKKYCREMEILPNEYNIKNLSLEDFKGFCGFDVKTIKKFIKEVEYLYPDSNDCVEKNYSEKLI